MTPQRAALIAQVAALDPLAPPAGWLRVGVDGVDGSGKTVFAAELSESLRAAGRRVAQVSLDDWHRERALRHARGRHSPEGFWLDSYDYDRIRAEVLTPLAAGGSGRYRARGHDLASDEVLTGPLVGMPRGGVLVVEGLFLQRAELEGCLDLVVWLDVPFAETARRMAVRDGTSPDPEDPSMRRYVEGQRRYFREREPWTRADLVVDNADVHAPVLRSR